MKITVALCFLVHAVFSSQPRPNSRRSLGLFYTEPEQPEPSPDPPKGKESKQVIESFHVQTDIRYRFATTQMCSVIRNTAGDAREIPFHVSLPKEAFIVSFSMTIDGKVYDGEVKEKKAAKEQYNRAVARGESAGHIRQTPRHSNRFDVSVNVANGSAVNFTLTYQQILARRLGVYEYEMHVQPGQSVQDFKVEVFIQENRPLLFVKTPKLRKVHVVSNTIEESNDLTVVDRPSSTTAHIKYIPTVDQQGPGGLSARFVVQYDVEHADKGDLLVVDGYFLHLFSPKPTSAPLPKDIIFVLDVSGSMSGTKLTQLIVAMKTILDDLNEQDRFNIFTFSDGVSKWKEVVTQATPTVIGEAKKFAQSMRARGGTNINEALLTAIDELQERELQERVGMIFFLTDGQPTVGESNPTKIANNIRKNNDGYASIYSLGFGTGANLDLLKSISAQNSGFARKIYEASDASLQVSSLYDEISAVAMKNVSVEYLPEIPKATETDFPVLFNGSEIVICGPWPRLNDAKPDSSETSLRTGISGVKKEGVFDFVIEIDDVKEITIDSDDSINRFFTMPRDYSGVVEKMWAFLTIKQLLKQKVKAAGDEKNIAALDEEILKMSLEYKFVTPLTSMVVTKPETDGNSGSDDKPIESGLEDADASSFISAKHLSMLKTGAAGHLGVRRKYSSPGRSRSRPSYKRRKMVSYGQAGPKLAGLKPMVAHSQAFIPPTIPATTATATTTTTTTPFTTMRAQTKKPVLKPNKGRNRGQKAKFSILSSISFRRSKPFGGHSLCLAPKKLDSGRYVILKMDNDLKIEVTLKCLRKKCRKVVPEQLILTSSGKTSTLNLTASSSWEYRQHPDFSVTIVKMKKMILVHDKVVISIIRGRGGKKMRYFLTFTLKSRTEKFSGMMDLMVDPQIRYIRQPPRPRVCRRAKTVAADTLRMRRARSYKV